MIQLSNRLQSVADLVGFCETMADVGTDHGYIPVYLVECKKTKRAIAMDVNKGPLLRAEEHIRQYGMEQKIETRLSDGLAALEPKEAEVIVIAGMGGALMMRILSQGAAAAQTAKRLVLQPQSELMTFRQFLFENGYQITAEDMVFEDGKYYPMMAVRFMAGDGAAISEDKQQGKQFQRMICKYGPVLLEQKHPILKQYLLQQKQQKQKILKNLQANARQNVEERKAEVAEELSDIEAALKLWTEKQK